MKQLLLDARWPTISELSVTVLPATGVLRPAAHQEKTAQHWSARLPASRATHNSGPTLR